MNPIKLFSPANWKKIYTLLYQAGNQMEMLEQLRKRFPSVTFSDDLRVNNPDNFKIGRDSSIGERTILKCGKAESGSIHVGHSTIVGKGVFLGAMEAPIIIGNYCDIGLGSILVTYSRDVKANTELGTNEHIHIHEPIEIGKGCMVAAGSIVLGGTVLGDNCIVGAGSVVKGKYPDNTTLIGNPARPIPRMEFS